MHEADRRLFPVVSRRDINEREREESKLGDCVLAWSLADGGFVGAAGWGGGFVVGATRLQGAMALTPALAPALTLALLAAALGRGRAQQCLVASTFLGPESAVPHIYGLAMDASGTTWMVDLE